MIAPASGFERGAFEAGLALLQARYRPGYGGGLFERERYLAGTDTRRLAELRAALADPGIRAVFCARGGYGATRLLTRLAVHVPEGPPKLLVGFSDITALHLWLQAHGRVSIHGPVLTQLPRLPPATCVRLFELLESARPAPPLTGTATYLEGVAEGPLLGGNLSVFTRLLGTPYMPALDDAILLLEDQGERPYRLARRWTHMQLAGVCARVRGAWSGLYERRGAARARREHRAPLRGRLSDRARGCQRTGAARRARASRCGCGDSHLSGTRRERSRVSTLLAE